MINGISLTDVSFGYQKNHLILKNISCRIEKGAFLGITGINGSGKTTFTYLLNGLIPHFQKGHLAGEVIVDDVSTQTKTVAYFAKKVGMVFQNPDFSLFNLTVEEEIAFGLKNLKLDYSSQKINQVLEIVGLLNYARRDPQTLSLGEKQKVCLAAVLAQETNYIVLDEPTSMLDYKSSLDLYRILQNLNQAGKTVITVEHDTDLLWAFAQEIIILDKGKFISSGEAKANLSNRDLLNRLGIKIPNEALKI